MDSEESIKTYLLGLPFAQQWPDLKAVLDLAISRQPRDWRLPLLASEAVGGSVEQAVPAAAAVACLQIAIILVDDMLDDDPRGFYREAGMAVSANLATAFQALGYQAVIQCAAPVEARLAAVQALERMMLVTAYGQHLDTQNPSDEPAYWRLVETKSSPFFSAALQAGAWLGGAGASTVAILERFGNLYGELIQLHDDLNDSMAAPANPDWLSGRSPLPILFAQGVDHPDRERFLTLRPNAADPQALSEAQSILIRCGAVSYVVDQIIRRYQAAEELLSSGGLVYRQGLSAFLEAVIEPVRRLFAEIEMEPGQPV